MSDAPEVMPFGHEGTFFRCLVFVVAAVRSVRQATKVNAYEGFGACGPILATCTFVRRGRFGTLTVSEQLGLTDDDYSYIVDILEMLVGDPGDADGLVYEFESAPIIGSDDVIRAFGTRGLGWKLFPRDFNIDTWIPPLDLFTAAEEGGA